MLFLLNKELCYFIQWFLLNFCVEIIVRRKFLCRKVCRRYVYDNRGGKEQVKQLRWAGLPGYVTVAGLAYLGMSQ